MEYIILLGVAVLIVRLATKLKGEKIKRLKEEIKHQKFNHIRQLNINLEIKYENEMLSRKYQEMLDENLRLNREFNRGLI